MTLKTTNQFCNYSPIKCISVAGYAPFGLYLKWSSPDRQYHLVILKKYFLDIFIIFFWYETVALWSVNAKFPVELHFRCKFSGACTYACIHQQVSIDRLIFELDLMSLRTFLKYFDFEIRLLSLTITQWTINMFNIIWTLRLDHNFRHEV